MTRGERINRIMIRLEEAVDHLLEKPQLIDRTEEFVAMTATLARFYALRQTSVQMQRRGALDRDAGDGLQ